MKKTVFAIFISVLLLATSCKKNDSGNNNNNLPQSTWTYKGTTYTSDTCYFVNGFMVAATSGSGYGAIPLQQMAFAFANNGVPSTSGTYNVVPYGQLGWSSVPNQIIIEAVGVSGAYSSTGGGTTSQTVQVTVSATGKVSISGTGIELKNTLTNSTDSTTLNLNVVQDF